MNPIEEAKLAPMKFKIEFELQGRTWIETYFAINLTDLFEQTDRDFPNAKIIGAIGGG